MQVIQVANEAFEVCFGVSSEKFLGFIVHKKWIDLAPAKAKDIQDMEPPTTCKQLKSFMGRVCYVCRFISNLIELFDPFHKLPEKNLPLWYSERAA